MAEREVFSLSRVEMKYGEQDEMMMDTLGSTAGNAMDEGKENQWAGG